MSLAVFLTAMGGVAIGLLAVIHQTLRMRAVRNAEVRTDVVPEALVADRVVAEMDDPATAAIADLDELLASSRTAIRQARIELAERGIKTHYGPIKESTSRAAAQLVKLDNELYQVRIRAASGNTIEVSPEMADRIETAMAARMGGKFKPPRSGKGVVHESLPSRPPRRDPAAPARATDRPPFKVK
ncbi:hypothetical protein GR238_33755 [Rhizobium leguminosarum]|uniref:hypothetical protein n=1 Tax=Rhizobium ruizarguesonis TaxID=2081791 RepID=UPI0013B87421|nr:hypothetical protein [Rhizobium ruizarguesonis]NEJ10333.1 hypothetical protein [Rhizobium ruizarguesonis]